jgi:hypothetical protein
MHFPSSLVIFGNLRSSLTLNPPLVERGSVTRSTSAIPVPLPVLCIIAKFIFSRNPPARFVLAGIGVIRDPAGGVFGGGGALIQIASGGSVGTQFAIDFNLRHRRCARSGCGLNRKRRREESLIPRGILRPPSPPLKLLKGLILLGNRVDKGWSQPLVFTFTVGDNAASKQQFLGC